MSSEEFDRPQMSIQRVRPLRQRLEQERDTLIKRLEKVNRALELLDKHPELTEFLDVVGSAVNL